MKKGFILDLDGTLLDSMGIWLEVDVGFLRKYGREPSPTLQLEIAVMSIQECAVYFKREYRLSQSEPEIIAEWLSMVEDFYRNRVQPKPGALDFVRFLSDNGCRMTVATGAQRPFAEAALARTGILPYISHLETVDELGIGKGFPDIYHLCSDFMGLDPSDCVVLEDVLSALQTAKSAGYETWAVYDKSSDRDWPAIRELAACSARSFPELLQQLR